MSLRRTVPFVALLAVGSWLAARAWRGRADERRREAQRRAERSRLIRGLRAILDSAENERPAALERLLARLDRGDDLHSSDVAEIARLLVEASDLVETGGYWYQDAVAEAEEAHDRAEAEHEQKEDWFSEAARLEREVGSLQRTLAAKEDELQHVQRNWRETQRHTWESDGAARSRETHHAAEEPSPGTVAAAVLLAKSNCPSLHFLAEADDSAATSPYIHPDRVYAAFRALDELSGARAVGPIGMSVHDWFKERGIDYAAHESGATMGKWGDERTYRYGGARWQMQEHIKFGVGPDPRHHLRIHLAWHEGESRWLIGHVGRHLTNTKTS